MNGKHAWLLSTSLRTTHTVAHTQVHSVQGQPLAQNLHLAAYHTHCGAHTAAQCAGATEVLGTRSQRIDQPHAYQLPSMRPAVVSNSGTTNTHRAPCKESTHKSLVHLDSASPAGPRHICVYVCVCMCAHACVSAWELSGLSQAGQAP